MPARFVHLRARSVYSVAEGALAIKALPGLCAEAETPAVALTDTNNMCGALEFSETAAKAGLQPIIGVSIAVAVSDAQRCGGKPAETGEIVLLAQSEVGYGNLLKLSSKLYLNGVEGARAVALEDIEARSQGLICLTGGPDGLVGRLLRAGRAEQAEATVQRLQDTFADRLYVELQRHPDGYRSRTQAEDATEQFFVETAYKRQLPIVATNDAHFAGKTFFAAHDAFLCIGSGTYVAQRDRKRLTPEHWFKPAREMIDLFSDMPEATENSVEIAHRCSYRPTVRGPILPRFAEDEVETLRSEARAGLARRLTMSQPAAPLAEYESRLAFELAVIEQMGFPGYFLIVADFIQWAKREGIPVGPGRGSGAGSLVAWALTITDLDPIRYGLLFERFLNPERVSMPDFDIDFCMDRREEVISYVQRRYGHERVAQIITFGAMLSKAAVRDVGRVLQLPYGQIDRLAKMIPMEGVKPVSVARARREEPRLATAAAEEPVVGELLDIAEKIEGLLRNASTHAAGVVIGDRPLDELVPLYRDPRSEMPATQFNMKWVESAGLVKFDFLGLKTLTVIKGAIDLLKQRNIEIKIEEIPLDDHKTFDLYGRADTVAVFQVESSGMRDALRQLRPTCIEDIIALVALYRPGPMENIPKYCNVKNGREARPSIHPLIDPILDETQGIIVYQEQVMEIARKMAGYSLGGADLLRRAMGKKIQAEMDAQRPLFLRGAADNKVDQKKAEEVWDLLNKFANYGFNKSHAAAYGLVSYQTAWLKSNYPVEFMSAVMNCDLHATDKLATFKREVDRLNIKIMPPCINTSDVRFSVADGRIIYALAALKGVGLDAVKSVITARETGGSFRSLADFAARVDLKRVGKRALETLVRSGAFDCLERNRRRTLAALDALIALSASSHDPGSANQISLFGNAVDTTMLRMPDVEDWQPSERLSEEFAAIGFYISGHPLDAYAEALKRKRVMFHGDVVNMTARGGAATVRMAGCIMRRQERKSARGNRFAFVELSDPTGLWEVTVFADTLARSRELLEPGRNVVLMVDVEAEGDQLKLLCRGATAVEEVTADASNMGLRLHIEAVDALEGVLRRMKMSDGPAGASVELVLWSEALGAEVDIAVPGKWPLAPAVRSAMKAVPGVREIEEF